MTLTHEQIEAQDLLDGYVTGRLDAATAEAVEAHYFECDVCFARVTELDALRGAVRDAVDHGDWPADAVPAPVPVAAAPRQSRIIVWSMAATAVLAAGMGWMAFVQMPALRSQLAATTAERDQSRLDLMWFREKAATPPPSPVEMNFGLITLSSERGVSDVPEFTATTDAPRLVLAIDGPQSPSGKGRLLITGRSLMKW